VRSGGDHERIGVDGDRFAAGRVGRADQRVHPDPLFGLDSPDGGLRVHRDAPQCVAETGEAGPLVLHARVGQRRVVAPELPAHTVSLIEEDDLCATRAGGLRGGEPGRARPEDHDARAHRVSRSTRSPSWASR
jgi:hypothetical protein